MLCFQDTALFKMLKAQQSWVVISFSHQQKAPLSYFSKVKDNRYPLTLYVPWLIRRSAGKKLSPLGLVEILRTIERAKPMLSSPAFLRKALKGEPKGAGQVWQ